MINKQYYKIMDDICVLCNDINIEDIEKFFNIKINNRKLFRSVKNLSYWIYNGNNWLNFNNFDLKIGE